MRLTLPGLIFLTLLVHSSPSLAVSMTPSHVFQETERLLLDIKLLRNAQNITGDVRDPGVQTNKTPLHVFAKALQVKEKIARTQQKFDIEPGEVPIMPTKKIVPADVFRLVRSLRAEVDRIMSKTGIVTSSEEPEFVTGKTPSQVYENLWRCSFLLDDLAGSIKPSYVYRNTELILSEINQIARSIGATLDTEIPRLQENIKPKDVNLEAFKNLYRITQIERKIGISRVKIPQFPATTISPADVFETTYSLLAELARIKIEMNIVTTPPATSLIDDKSPAEVLVQMQLIGTKLIMLANAIVAPSEHRATGELEG